MLDTIKYINSKGEEVNFSSSPIYSSTKALREFMSKYKNGKILDDTDADIELLVVMLCDSAEKNKIFDVLDYDTATEQIGRLYVNDWYVPCYFMGISKVEHDDDKSFKGSLEFCAPKMEFLKETTYVFRPNTGDSTGFNFPHNIPFNYSAKKASIVKINNSTASDADFIFQFTGEVPFVEFSIGNVRYVINSQVLTGEKFKIDTFEKQIYKTKDGEIVDLFGSADDETYIFTMIPPGAHPLSWRGEFAVEFTLIEHRRYPVWI